MNLTQFLQALRARRKAFFVTLVAVIATAIGVTLVIPKKYEATATLLMDARDEQVLSPTRLSPREHLGYIATQVDLIQSGRVAAQVARVLKLADRPGMREAWQQETGGSIQIEDWIAQNLLEKLKADVTASNVVTIKYASSDPQHATAVANAFAKAYLDTTLEMRTQPSRDAAAWLEGQLKNMRGELMQAQSKLTSFQRAKGITFADERSDTSTTRLTELSTAYAAARSANHDAQIRYKQAQEVLASGTPDAMSEIMTSASIVSVRAELARAEAAYQTASADLGPNHPVYQRTEGEVKALREKLNSEMKKVVTALGTAAQQARQREEDLAKQIAAQNDHIQMMKDARVELAAMTRDVDNAQRAHDTVLARFVTNKIESTA